MAKISFEGGKITIPEFLEVYQQEEQSHTGPVPLHSFTPVGTINTRDSGLEEKLKGVYVPEENIKEINRFELKRIKLAGMQALEITDQDRQATRTDHEKHVLYDIDGITILKKRDYSEVCVSLDDDKYLVPGEALNIDNSGLRNALGLSLKKISVISGGKVIGFLDEPIACTLSFDNYEGFRLRNKVLYFELNKAEAVVKHDVDIKRRLYLLSGTLHYFDKTNNKLQSLITPVKDVDAGSLLLDLNYVRKHKLTFDESIYKGQIDPRAPTVAVASPSQTDIDLSLSDLHDVRDQSRVLSPAITPTEKDLEPFKDPAIAVRPAIQLPGVVPQKAPVLRERVSTPHMPFTPAPIPAPVPSATPKDLSGKSLGTGKPSERPGEVYHAARDTDRMSSGAVAPQTRDPSTPSQPMLTVPGLIAQAKPTRNAEHQDTVSRSELDVPIYKVRTSGSDGGSKKRKKLLNHILAGALGIGLGALGFYALGTQSQTDKEREAWENAKSEALKANYDGAKGYAETAQKNMRWYEKLFYGIPGVDSDYEDFLDATYKMSECAFVKTPVCEEVKACPPCVQTEEKTTKKTSHKGKKKQSGYKPNKRTTGSKGSASSGTARESSGETEQSYDVTYRPPFRDGDPLTADYRENIMDELYYAYATKRGKPEGHVRIFYAVGRDGNVYNAGVLEKESKGSAVRFGEFLADLVTEHHIKIPSARDGIYFSQIYKFEVKKK